MTEYIKQNFENGARFVRADLHIHSYGENGSYDVKDSQMTVENIIEKSITEGIKIISITDHNSIANVKNALKYAEGKDILVLPGVELSTTQGHLLLYFKDLNKLENCVGKLTISADKKECEHTISQCLEIARNFEGFGIAAHIDVDAGFETYVSGYPPSKSSIFKNTNLLGLEITKKENTHWFTDEDDSKDRVALIKLHRKETDKEEDYQLAKVMNSDAHSFKALGVNLSGNKRLTRIKIDELSFDSVRIAFTDSDARIRLEEDIPETVPHFESITLEGGMLGGQVIKLSKNLNCIIGGRGTGKSTLLNSLIATSGNEITDAVRESLDTPEVGSDRVDVVFVDQVSQKITFSKERYEDNLNVFDPIDGIDCVPIEFYGQGKTAQTISQCGKNPGVLLNFLDTFFDFKKVKEEEELIREQLLENQTLVEKLRSKVLNKSDIERAKKHADKQIQNLKDTNAKEVIEKEENLVRERDIRDGIIQDIHNQAEGMEDFFADLSWIDEIVELDDSSVGIGKKEFSAIKKVIEGYRKTIDDLSEDAQTKTDSLKSKVDEHMDAWSKKEKVVQDEIDEIRKKIVKEGGVLDIGYIRKVTKDASDRKKELATIVAAEKELLRTLKERDELVKRRLEIRTSVYTVRNSFAKKLNLGLKSSVIDLSVSIKFEESNFSDELQDIIKETMSWRTSAVPKAEYMVKQGSYSGLLTAVKKNNKKYFTSIKDTAGQTIFTDKDADSLMALLAQEEVLFRLQRAVVEDTPKIIVSKKIESSFVSKDFSKLSMGQQQSVLLAILLHSDSNYPLLIDQPEDNLDSEFIYKTLVKNFRKIKEKRQVIVVTHNPNIAVLGDAELIIPLKSTSTKTRVVKSGSIDNTDTRQTVCETLEGGKDAFKKRKEIYGI